MPSSWDHRIARAGELQEKHPAASELLKFYQQLARFQKGVYEKLASLRGHDVSVLLPFFPQLIALAKREGSVVPAAWARATEPSSRIPREIAWRCSKASGSIRWRAGTSPAKMPSSPRPCSSRTPSTCLRARERRTMVRQHSALFAAPSHWHRGFLPEETAPSDFCSAL